MLRSKLSSVLKKNKARNIEYQMCIRPYSITDFYLGGDNLNQSDSHLYNNV